ncbi:MAG: dTDP-4-dehydrorhamnose reductase [Bacilli bacterium]|nr:dTDP-4-dehydrorhamnose reductase [Bacilli bacterium]
MKFFITGVNGQLGYDVKRELLERGYTDILAPTRVDLDITNEDAVKKMIREYRPSVIFHCAAYTAVDKAEEEQEKCYQVNVLGTKYLTEAAKEVGAKIIYISTDYVFDGTKEGLYQIEDKVNPVNYYGKTKYLGENFIREYDNHIIVRISWVFGINGKNFIRTMLNLAESHKELNVVCDQIGSPTYTKDLAGLLVNMFLSNVKGLYHVTNEGYCSWYEFAEFIFKESRKKVKVHPILTKDYKTIAKRPLNSKLSKESLDDIGMKRLPEWQDAVKRYIRELKKEGVK